MKKVLCCKCGGRIVENDGHFVCENYLEDIRLGVREQQAIIEQLKNELELNL